MHLSQTNKPGKNNNLTNNVFNEDTIYVLNQNAFYIGSKISKGNIKDDAAITSNIYNEKMNFRVKLSRFSYSDRKQYYWLNYRAIFEAISEASGIEETLNEFLGN